MKTIYKVLIAILILVLIGEYYYFVERKAIEIDRYNFQQLEKAKKVIENIPKNKKTYRVRNLKQLNSKFKADIEPLDKRYCYYVYYSFDKENNKPVFEFGFKLHSLLYKLMYMSDNYAYPKLIKRKEPSEACKEERKLPYMGLTGMPACAGLNAHYSYFISAISEPCER